MEIKLNREEKRLFVAWLNGVFAKSGSVVVAHYSGLTVSHLYNLRFKMREAGGSVKVAKNRLARIALRGTESESLSDLFFGQTLIAYAEDPMIAPRVLVNFAKDNANLVVLGGGMGRSSLRAEDVVELANLPSLDELRAKLVGVFAAPASNIARLVNAPAAKLARVFVAYADNSKVA